MKYYYALLLIMATSMAKAQLKVDNVVFGIFCGKCSKHCATLYAYSSQDQKTLYVDSTDSYFQQRDAPIICQTPVHDSAKIQLVQQLIADIPDELLYRTELTRTFGCPDCSDQCGIYMEFVNHQSRYRFYIDTQPDQLKGNVKDFAAKVIKVVGQLKAR
jgi:hypothetical protein